MTTQTVTLNEVEAKQVRFTSKGREYLWTLDGKRPEGESSLDVEMLVDINADWGSGQWYIFAIVESYFPPCFAIQHRSFESAYEEFCDWQVDRLKIEDGDLKDYDDESLNYSGNGVPIDTESIQGFEAHIVEVKC